MSPKFSVPAAPARAGHLAALVPRCLPLGSCSRKTRHAYLALSPWASSARCSSLRAPTWPCRGGCWRCVPTAARPSPSLRSPPSPSIPRSACWRGGWLSGYALRSSRGQDLQGIGQSQL